MPDYPNIFTSQSKEFSQDAFIDWLFRCANPSNPDSETRIAGRAFIRYLFRKHNALVAELNASERNVHTLLAVDPDLPIAEVLSVRQYMRIDVMGRINGGGGLYIIFENKLGTEIHDEQVTRYREDLRKSLTEKYGDGKGQILGVYYKVLEERDFEAVRWKYHYCTLSRREMRDFLSDHTARNPILEMYHDYLEKLDTQIHEWKRMTAPEMESGEHAGWALWSGWFSELYQELKLRLKDDSTSSVGWGWINNVKGGFHGLWLGNWANDQTTVYLQCDEHELKVRMSGPRTGAAMHETWSWLCAQLKQITIKEKAGRMQHNAQTAEIGNLGAYIQADQTGMPSIPLTADYILEVFRTLKAASTAARSRTDIPPLKDDAKA